MAAIHSQIWLSLGVIAASCLAGTLLRMKFGKETFQKSEMIVYWLLSTFISLCIWMIVHSTLDWDVDFIDEIVVSALYVLVVPPNNLVGRE